MTQRYMFDPPEGMTIDDLADFFRVMRVEINSNQYDEAPDRIKRLFKPSIFAPSPSRMLN